MYDQLLLQITVISRTLILKKPKDYCQKSYPRNRQHCPVDGNPHPVQSKKQVSQCIHKISKCHWILDNQHKNPIISTVHAHTKINGYTKYEQDPLNIVGCRMVMRVGRIDRRMDIQTDSTEHNNTLQPEWAEGKKMLTNDQLHVKNHTWEVQIRFCFAVIQ